LFFDMAATEGHHEGSFKWMPDALRGRKWGVLCYASSMLSVDVAAGSSHTRVAIIILPRAAMNYGRSSAM
jgi:hypothetical protein